MFQVRIVSRLDASVYLLLNSTFTFSYFADFMNDPFNPTPTLDFVEGEGCFNKKPRSLNCPTNGLITVQDLTTGLNEVRKARLLVNGMFKHLNSFYNFAAEYILNFRTKLANQARSFKRYNYSENNHWRKRMSKPNSHYCIQGKTTINL